MKIEYNNLYTHFVFTTFNRLPLIVGSHRERIEKYITGIVKQGELSCQKDSTSNCIFIPFCATSFINSSGMFLSYILPTPHVKKTSAYYFKRLNRVSFK